MSASYLNSSPYAALRCTLADGVSAEPRGRAQGSAILPHLVLSTMRTVAAVVALVACVHAGLWAMLRDDARAPNFGGQLASVSYAPFEGSAHPDSGAFARAAQIRADLKLLAPLTRAIRTYSATGGVELVPGIATEFGLRVTAGAWIDKNQDRNEREIRSVIEQTKRHSNINGIIVGNETIFRGEQKVSDLIPMIQRVKRSTNVPVTTGEIWHVWIEHPELVSAVDYIAAHILPYWEGFSETQAVDQAVLIYDKLRKAYPGKRIVIAEFGWPSAGYNYKNANPGRIDQAVVLRDFVTRAEAYGIDYNIVEAIDQPWKIFEGGVGPYWGIFDAARHPKFEWTGPITDPDHWRLAAIAILVSVLLSLPLLAMSAVTVWQAVMLAASANFVGAWFAAVFGYWNGHYFVPGAAFALGLGMILLVPLDRDRARTHRRNRRHRVRTQAASADCKPAACARSRPHRKFPSTFRPITNRRRCSSRRSMQSPGSTTRITNASS